MGRWSPAVTRLSLLVDLSTLLAREVDLDTLLVTACARVARALDADRATVWLVDAERDELTARVASSIDPSVLRLPLGGGVAGWVAARGEPVRIDDAPSDARFDGAADRASGYVTRTMLAAPIRESPSGPVRGVLQVLNAERGHFDASDETSLVALGLELGHALSLTSLRPARAADPGLRLRGPFNHIVGTSPAMRRTYEHVALAAQTDASVLFTGETGTGKGLFARAVHVNSVRQAQPFVTVDCTALPEKLIESELFGHERGAFTGADRRVRGKLELADGGTLFLDELGELPLEAQAKLLRLLQERVFERVGGRETIHVDLRVIAATHRDLGRAVREGRFRQDLYYRVRVVEIAVPPLRQRGDEEVWALARHFAERYAERYRRPLPRFDAAALSALATHDWPGNVRELEHWVESAVVLSPSGQIRPELFPAPSGSESERRRASASVGEVRLPRDLSLDEASQRYARAVLADAAGNQSRAAERLGIGRNTLARLLKR